MTDPQAAARLVFDRLDKLDFSELAECQTAIQIITEALTTATQAAERAAWAAAAPYLGHREPCHKLRYHPECGECAQILGEAGTSGRDHSCGCGLDQARAPQEGRG